MNTGLKLLCAVGGLLLASCYEDKGNYDYHDINDIVIKSTEYSYTTPKEGRTDYVLLEPTITQTMTPGGDNLSYEWKRNLSANKWEVVGDAATYRLEVTSADTRDIRLRLAVTDTDLGIATYEEFLVSPIFAFSQCWFVLQDIDGQAVLGSVDGSGTSRVISKDVYQRENGSSLSGRPLSLGLHRYLRTTPLTSGLLPNWELLLGVFTDAQPYVLKASTLEPHAFSYQRLLYEKKINNDPTFDFRGIRSSSDGCAILDDGKFWYSFPDEFSLFYPVRIGQELGDDYDYEATVACEVGTGQQIIYDKRGNRFLYYYNSNMGGGGYNDRKAIATNAGAKDNLYTQDRYNNTARMEAIGENGHANAFNPSALPGGFQLDNMAYCLGDGSRRIMAIGHVGSTFHVFEFSPAALEAQTPDPSVAFCTATWTVPVMGDGASLGAGKIEVAVSRNFERMFFYAAGNKIYRVDLTQASPVVTPLYELSDPTSKIKMLKMKSDSNDIAYEVPGQEDYSFIGVIGHLGAIAENTSGEANLIEMQLTAAGEIERDKETDNPIVYEFNGSFKHVVDFVFSFRAKI